MPATKLEGLATKLGFAKADELFAAVARDEVNLRQLQVALRTLVQLDAPKRPLGVFGHSARPAGG